MSKPAKQLRVGEAVQIKTSEPSASNGNDGSARTATSGDTSKAAPVAPPKSTFREYLESFIVTLIMAFFGMTFIVQAVTVPTGSMQNTIVIGDHLLVNKFKFAPGATLPFLPMREIQRGDIVVFKYPGNVHAPEIDRAQNSVKYQTHFVKRVIGLPGDTIEFRNNQVFVNGNLLPENRLLGSAPDEVAALTVREFEPRTPNADYNVYYNPRTMQEAERGRLVLDDDLRYGVPGGQTKVPDNSYFVMGDSRDNSSDSRVWGFVDRDLIVGQAMFVYWSYDYSKPQNNPVTDLFTNTRWDRIGTLIK